MIKRLVIAIVLLVLIGGGLVGFNLFRNQAIEQFFANRPVQPTPVATVTVGEAAWKPTIDAIGTVSASRGADLAVETAGTVKSIEFEPNQQIKAGDLLVQLDDAVQRADLQAARADLDLKEQAQERARELQQRGVGSDVTLQAATAAANTAIAQVEKLKAVLQQKQLRAPFDGTIGIPQVDIGQYVSPGTVAVTLQDLENLRVDFSLPEQRLSDLKAGQPIRIGIVEDDLPISGMITGIDPKIDPSSRLVSVRGEFKAGGLTFSPGQFVRLKVELPEEDGVLAVPQTAVVSSLYGDYVYTVRKDEDRQQAEGGTEPLEVRQAFVTVGRSSGDRVEIVRGLESGAVVVVSGQNRLVNGGPVTINNDIVPGSQSQADAQ